jgi:phospholipid/cholesterol/gamma-HCH transport system substrate-binding protein
MRDPRPPRDRSGRFGTFRRTTATGVVAVLVLALAAFAAVRHLTGSKDLRVTASFDRVVGLYEGDDVRVLGVKVGTVTGIDRRTSQVLVHLKVDGGIRVPADASAVVIAPTLVSGRYVQLTPAYTAGATMAQGAVIPEPRTHVPAEFDDLKSALNRLGTDLGPNGPGAKDGKGSLSRAVDTAAANLEGQGRSMHETLVELSDAVTTLSNSREDIFGTVRAMAEFTEMLARTDAEMRSFTTNTATLSGQLADSRKLLATTLAELAALEPQLQAYLRTDTPLLHDTTAKLSTLSTLLARNRQNLADILQVAPTAISNTYNIYDPVVRGQTGTLVLPYMATPGQIICWMFGAVGAAALCPQLPNLASTDTAGTATTASTALLQAVGSGTTTIGSVASLLSSQAGATR